MRGHEQIATLRYVLTLVCKCTRVHAGTSRVLCVLARARAGVCVCVCACVFHFQGYLHMVAISN